MKAYELIQAVMENSKTTKHVDGELSAPRYDNIKTPDNHVSGKKTKTVDGKKGLGDKSFKKNGGNPGDVKQHERRPTKQITPGTKKMTEGDNTNYYMVNISDPQSERVTMSQVEVIRYSPNGFVVDRDTAKKLKRKLKGVAHRITPYQMDDTIDETGIGRHDYNPNSVDNAIKKDKRIKPGEAKQIHRLLKGRQPSAAAREKFGKKPQTEGMKFDKAPVKDEMGVPSVAKDSKTKARTASVRTKQPDDAKATADVGKPDQNKAFMQARAVSVKKVQEGMSELEDMLGIKINIGEGEDGKANGPFNQDSKSPDYGTAKELFQHFMTKRAGWTAPDGTAWFIKLLDGEPKSYHGLKDGRSVIMGRTYGEVAKKIAKTVFGMRDNEYIEENSNSNEVVTECGCQDTMNGIMQQFGFESGASPKDDQIQYERGGDIVVFVLSDGAPSGYEFYRNGNPGDAGEDPERLERILSKLFGQNMSESPQGGLFNSVWKRPMGEGIGGKIKRTAKAFMHGWPGSQEHDESKTAHVRKKMKKGMDRKSAMKDADKKFS